MSFENRHTRRSILRSLGYFGAGFAGARNRALIVL